MKSLDLHGIKHEDVKRVLDEFFWDMMKKNVSYFEVITGFSDRMKSIVYETCDEYGFEVEENPGNGGSLTIFC